jgi:hypothetical protein
LVLRSLPRARAVPSMRGLRIYPTAPENDGKQRPESGVLYPPRPAEGQIHFPPMKWSISTQRVKCQFAHIKAVATVVEVDSYMVDPRCQPFSYLNHVLELFWAFDSVRRRFAHEQLSGHQRRS